MIDFSLPNIQFCLLLIPLAPIWWNSIGRIEYKFRPLTKLTGNPYFACYVATVLIFSFSTFRDYIFHLTIAEQPKLDWMINSPICFYLGVALFCFGQLLVWTSFLKLGITGTFLGDYMGILMDAPVTSFPFNAFEHPIAFSFLGNAIWSGSVAGLVLAGFVFACYMIAATYFEGPFTTAIYAKRAAKTE